MHVKMITLLSKIETPALSTLNISKEYPKTKLKVTSLIPFIHKTPAISQINITGHWIIQDKKELDYSTNPKININWINNPTIDKIKYSQAGSNTEINLHTSEPEESTSDSTVENSDTDY
jgi:hypothetical protein